MLHKHIHGTTVSVLKRNNSHRFCHKKGFMNTFYSLIISISIIIVTFGGISCWSPKHNVAGGVCCKHPENYT